MRTASEDKIEQLARQIAPTRWRVHDALLDLESRSSYIAPSDALDLLTRTSRSVAIHTLNISSGNSTDFSTGSGHNVHYRHTPGEDAVEQIARLLEPEEWNIHDRLVGWGNRTGDITPEWILALLTSPSMDRAARYHRHAVSLSATD